MSGFYLGGHSDFRQFTPAVSCCVPDTHMSQTDSTAEKRFEDQLGGVEDLPMPSSALRMRC